MIPKSRSLRRALSRGASAAAFLAALACEKAPEASPAAATPAPAAPAPARASAPTVAATTGAALPSPSGRVFAATAVAVASSTSVASWEPIFWRPAAPIAAPAATESAADAARTAALRAAPAADWERTATWWEAGAVRRWQTLARMLVVRHRQNPGFASRQLAALAVAQHDAALAASRAAPSGALVDGALAQAAVDVIGYLEPSDRRFLEQNALAHLESKIWRGAIRSADAEAGRAIGAAAAAAVVERLAEDGANAARHGPLAPREEDRWYFESQLLPGWGGVRSWSMPSNDRFRSPEPPALDSPEFAAALAEIRSYSDRLSAEQLAIAQYWNAGEGSLTVPGLWNEIADEALAAAPRSELATARLFALLDTALMDAGIACWETKFHYRYPRPSMRDPAIQEPLGLPAMPSYTSGHSAFSGAAERILACLFPERADEWRRMAEEASASRWYGGIHYRFDGDVGLEQGRAVAGGALARFAPDLDCAAAR
jgi:hypothetical protein